MKSLARGIALVLVASFAAFGCGDEGSVEFNEPPEVADLALSTQEHVPLAIEVSAEDPDGDPLTWTLVSGPAHGTLSGELPDVTYTPEAEFNGTDAVVVAVEDATFPPVSATVSIEVLPVNDPPTALDATVTTTAETTIEVVLAGEDLDGDPLEFTIAEAPTSGTLSELDSATGAVTYTPDELFVGSDAFTFTVSDGEETSPPATVTVEVAPWHRCRRRLPRESRSSRRRHGVAVAPLRPQAVAHALGAGERRLLETMLTGQPPAGRLE